jgi:glycosyltransferase involved in cell wall biosynthesis
LQDILVIIPAYCAERTLPLCLEAVLQSTIRQKIQVVVVDDGGNSHLPQLLAPYPVQCVSTGESHSAAYARDLGTRQHDSKILVFIDADVIIEPDAIERLVQPLLSGVAEATVGNYSKKLEGLNFAQSYKQLYISHIYSRRKGYIDNEFWTALGAIRTSIYRQLGGFNSVFRGARGEDIELGIRLTRTHYRILQVPDAVGQHLHAFNFATLLRNDLTKGLNLVQNIMRGDTSVVGNRHSSIRDVCAVLFAGLLVIMGLGTCLAVVSLEVVLLAGLPMFFSYHVARGDLLWTFRHTGYRFLQKAIPTMYLLDLVRGFCVLMGFLLVWYHSKRHAIVANVVEPLHSYGRDE